MAHQTLVKLFLHLLVAIVFFLAIIFSGEVNLFENMLALFLSLIASAFGAVIIVQGFTALFGTPEITRD